MKRVSSIDFYRGLATISVILIHTVFWSGNEYTPQVLKSLVLLLDVPFFFFISGQTGRLSQNSFKPINGLVNMWKKWIFFLLFAECVCLLLNLDGMLNFRDFVNNSFLLVSMPGLPVIKGSVWFLRVYFKVIPFVTIILIISNRVFDDVPINKMVDLFMSLCLLGLIIQAIYGSTDGVVSYLLFYSFFYLLGYRTLKCSLKKEKAIILMFFTAIGAKFMAYIFGKSLANLQDVKFPPHIVYLFVSLMGIWIALFLGDKIKYGVIGRLIIKIGEESLWFYFAQGISSSLLYYFVKNLQFKYWGVKVVVLFGINLVFAVLIALVLLKAWKLWRRLCGLIMEKAMLFKGKMCSLFDE